MLNVSEFNELLTIFPEDIQKEIEKFDYETLVDVVIDIGRCLTVRSNTVAYKLENIIVDRAILDFILSKLPDFNTYDRAALPNCLHRVSCIKNSTGVVVGLTCRLGKAVTNAASLIRDILEDNKSILIIGSPGAGKSTMLRDAAKICANDLKRRTIVIDPSNELAGDADTPHYSIGDARRMQIPIGRTQSEIMIRAVTNHTPQVIIIDEIGHSGDVSAARTIAERGVQLIATAHGQTIDNILENPMLADLLGGIQTVTISDEEAKKRGCRKTILERKYAPTFDVIVEILEIGSVAIHYDSQTAVDGYLAGYILEPEVRGPGGIASAKQSTKTEAPTKKAEPIQQQLKLYTFGVGSRKVDVVLEEMGIDFEKVKDPSTATLIVTLKRHEAQFSYLKKAKILLLRSNTRNAALDTLQRLFKES